MTKESEYWELHQWANKVARDPRLRVLAHLKTCMAECDRRHTDEEVLAAAEILGIGKGMRTE